MAGVFEGIKAYWNQKHEQLYVFRLSEHMHRFIQSIRMVRFAFDYSVTDLNSAVLELLKANKYKRSVYIRPYIFQKGIIRKLLQAVPGKPVELIIDSWPFQAHQDPSLSINIGVTSCG